MNILVLTQMFPPAPGRKNGNFVLDQVLALSRSGHTVTVLVCHPWVPRLIGTLFGRRSGKVDIALYKGYPFELLTATYLTAPRYGLGMGTGPLLLARLYLTIRELAAAKHINVIHAHGELMGYVATRSASRLGIGSVVTLHGIDELPRLRNSKRKREQLRRTLEEAGAVVLVGTPLDAFYSQFVTSTRNFHVVTNGFQLPVTIAAQSRIPKRAKTRIASVCNLQRNKGVDLVLDAMHLLLKEGHDLELVIVGNGPEQQALKQQATALSIEERVHCTGELLHPDAVAEIAMADIFCLPSWQEACGLVYMEAMALGRVTIGCQGQGPADFIQHCRTGYLAVPRSSESLSDLLRELLSNWPAAQAVAAEGRRFARQALTWDHNVDALTAIYEDVVHSMRSNIHNGQAR